MIRVHHLIMNLENASKRVCRSVYCKRASDRILPPLVSLTSGLIWRCQLDQGILVPASNLNGSDNSLYR